MAIKVNKPEVGTLVYLPFSPVTIGVITELREVANPLPRNPDHKDTEAWVTWLNGKLKGGVWHGFSWRLSDFDALIADHEKKLATHRANRLKALAEAHTRGLCPHQKEL
jgi:hypothetical protein